MTANVGTVDRTIRYALALVLFSFFWWATGPLKIVGFVGFLPLLTGTLGFCPLYSVLGIRTCPVSRGR